MVNTTFVHEDIESNNAFRRDQKLMKKKPEKKWNEEEKTIKVFPNGANNPMLKSPDYLMVEKLAKHSVPGTYLIDEPGFNDPSTFEEFANQSTFLTILKISSSFKVLVLIGGKELSWTYGQAFVELMTILLRKWNKTKDFKSYIYPCMVRFVNIKERD